MTPAEKIADDTWHKLKDARNLTVRLGEETLTDLLVLDLKRHETAHKSWVHQTPGWQEKIFGTDLLVVVRSGSASARLYAIQSKKLYPSGHYEALKKQNNMQLYALENFAYCNKALPYFLFYNFVTDRRFVAAPSNFWHCGKSYDESQLGCTLVPSWIVRKAVGESPEVRPRSFEYMHEPKPALPWRCLFDCQHWEAELRDRWPHSGDQDSLAGGIPPYDWVNVDPPQGAWPTELSGGAEVDLAEIAERFVDGLERDLAPDSLPPEFYPRAFIADHREMTSAPGARPPEFRPRRFIFVDKGIQ